MTDKQWSEVFARCAEIKRNREAVWVEGSSGRGNPGEMALLQAIKEVRAKYFLDRQGDFGYSFGNN